MTLCLRFASSALVWLHLLSKTSRRRERGGCETREASVAQTAAFAVCGSSLGSRFRNRGQTPVIENCRRCKVRTADLKNGGARYIRLASGVAVRVRWR